MPRIFEQFDPERHGRLSVAQPHDLAPVEVYFSPPPSELALVDPDVLEGLPESVKILELDYLRGRVTICPIITLGSKPSFLQPRYSVIRRISLRDAKSVLSVHEGESTPEYHHSMTFGRTEPIESPLDAADIAEPPATEEAVMEILEGLPAGFTKNYDHGLGLAQPYRFIVNVVEELSDADEIVISNTPTTIDQKAGKFRISWYDYDEIRKALNRVTSHGRHAAMSVKHAETHNYLAEKVGADPVSVKLGRHALRKLFTTFLEGKGDALVSEKEQEQLLTAMSKSASVISETKPERLLQLQTDIERVNMATLIRGFQEMLGENHEEAVWQKFLEGNPIILSMGFGYPIITVRGSASVGGRRLSGRGDTIADFLVKNSMTNNAAIVEIKTPTTRLLNEKAYREGVFVPSRELAGGINQVLDQKQQLETAIAYIKDRSGIYDLETYGVQGCLIVGTMPTEDERKRSFEMFRCNSKAVTIVTFDELLERLRNLERFLAGQKTNAEKLREEDLPF